MSDMPAKYQLTTTTQSVWDDGDGSVKSEIPPVVLRDWLGLKPGMEINAAPHDTREIHIGIQVPNILGSAKIRDMNPNQASNQPRCEIPAKGIDYLGVDETDSIDVEKVSDRVVRVCPENKG